VSFGNGLGNARTSAVQIRLTRPLKIRTRPIDDHRRQERRPLDRADDGTLDAEAEPEGDHEREAEGEPLVDAVVFDQRPGDVGGEHRHLTLGEVDHAGRPVDQHERERERREDRAGGEPCDDLLEELGHQWLLR